VPVYIGDFWGVGQASCAASGLDPEALFAYEPRSFRLKKAENQANRHPDPRESAMSRRCELTGKGLLVGNNVSHANNKTKKIYRPNLQTIALASELLGNSYKLRISMNALRSVDRNGGLDPFILKCKDSTLSPKALRLKRAIAKKAAAKAA
jgi:large subunit ribosomal protein L28